MTTAVRQREQTDLAPPVRAVLAELRRRIRRYVWLLGAAAAIAWLGGAFWISLAIDWIFEPPGWVRAGLLVIAGLGLVWLVWTLLMRRIAVPLGDRHMAMLLERRFPRFQESLLTAVELAEQSPDEVGYDARMLARTAREAAAAVSEVRVGEVFNHVPLRRAALGAAVLAASVAALALAAPWVVGVWANRSLLLSNELWPRRALIVVDGFDRGPVKVARGSDLTVIARADLRKPLVPETLEVRYRMEGGPREERTMSREGAADRAQGDRYQEYSHTFSGILTPIRFDVFGGDAAVRDLEVQVVESPAVVGMTLECEYPAYMARPQRALPVIGVMQLPIGTRVTLQARANKELVRIEAETADDESPQPPQAIKPMRGDARGFGYELGEIAADHTLLFTLYDADGIKSREPARLAIAAAADQAPHLALQLRGIGSAITPQARLPIAGQVTDDYGLAGVWFEHALDEGEARQLPLTAPSAISTALDIESALEVGELGLQPGQKFTMAVKAADRANLGAGPNVGTSERWVLDVVTPDELRTLLEARELVLRERFESIITEVTETRDLLARLELPGDAAARAQGAPSPAAESPSAAGTAAGREPDDSEPGDTEPGDEAAAAESPQRLASLRRLRVDRAGQNSQKDAHEVAGVAEAFANIRQELVNNRIDTEELKLRLEDGIAGPLRQVAEEMFPELDRRLARLGAALEDAKVAPENRRLALEQLDAILRQMRQALGKMTELEDFNEAVELLREIIAAQEKLGEETESQQKAGLRGLLLEDGP